MNKELFGELKRLSSYFLQPLYVVGGTVRNCLLGYEIDDIDLAAPTSPEEVFTVLKGTEFTVSETSKKLFTLSIRSDNYKYEFTSFRKDSYEKGVHRPYATVMTTSLEDDAKRRDFTMNAIYYDITKEKIFDPLKGQEAIEKRIIATVDVPQKVFSEDGLRLMRLARQAGELGMEIEEKTLEEARKNAHLIKDIAPERIRDEFNKIVFADIKYGVKKAHLKAFRLLDSIGVLQYILPELCFGKGMKQRKDFHIYDVFEHSLKAFEIAPKEVRLGALFHDIGKPACILEIGSMKGHDKKGEEIVRAIMTRLRYSNAEKSFVARLVKLHMYDLNCQAKEATLRGFVQENADIIENLITLKKVDYEASGVLTNECQSATKLETIYNAMKEEKIPLAIKDLKVKGKDLIELCIPEEKRGIVLKSLLKATIFGGDMLKRENQLLFLKKNAKR